ncbi:hypothetical protein ACFV2N_48005 [Streptomyces sp. NPDC059680]|uniref:hypothetical protein n=1 Tax=Streptomyces sp. NPDC059680 TaxID=3346904 RepID=UPI003675A2C8
MPEHRVDPATRAQAMRLRTVQDIDFLIARLRRIRRELARCPDDVDRMRALLHRCTTMTSIWLDDLICRYADTGLNANETVAAAWELVDSLALKPSGFESAADPAFFSELRGAAAEALARLWLTGYHMGPVPFDAWPSPELARLLLRALEHHADCLVLSDDLRRAGLDAGTDEPSPDT